MKKILLSSLLLLIVVIFNSCSSGTSASGQVNHNTVGSPFTLKYEIITSSTIVVPVTGTIITYENGTQQPETDNSFTSGTT